MGKMSKYKELRGREEEMGPGLQQNWDITNYISVKDRLFPVNNNNPGGIRS